MRKTSLPSYKHLPRSTMSEGGHANFEIPIILKVGLLWSINVSFLETQPYIICCSTVAMMPSFALKAIQSGCHQSHEPFGFSTAKYLSAKSTFLMSTRAKSDRVLPVSTSACCLRVKFGLPLGKSASRRAGSLAKVKL